MNYRFITQESESEEYGKIAHIDFYSEKTCSFDCVYCEDGSTSHKTTGRKYLFSAALVMDELDDYIEKNSKPDYVWYSCKGEPTINLMFGKITTAIKTKYPDIKIGTWTNGTLLSREDVFKELSLCDNIIVDFDSVLDEEFRRLNRPFDSLNIEKIMSDLIRFSNYFEGKFYLHTVFMKGFNDSKENLEGIKEFLAELKLDTFQVSFGTKNPEGPVSDEFKEQIKEEFTSTHYKLKI
ncbi:MAG: radical SAM protein [Candidatus Heimdallarchaeota archaeon]